MKFIYSLIKAILITLVGVTVPTVGALQVKSIGFMVYIFVVWFICLYYIGMNQLEKQS